MEVLREQLRLDIKEELQKEFEAEFQARIAYVADVEKEIERVGEQLDGIAREIGAMLDDPAIELSRVMRKRTEQAELKAYLNGLRFSIGEGKAKAAGI
jgi:hypothetical protein